MRRTTDYPVEHFVSSPSSHTPRTVWPSVKSPHPGRENLGQGLRWKSGWMRWGRSLTTRDWNARRWSFRNPGHQPFLLLGGRGSSRPATVFFCSPSYGSIGCSSHKHSESTLEMLLCLLLSVLDVMEPLDAVIMLIEDPISYVSRGGGISKVLTDI